MKFVRFVCELYGRLELYKKIDEILEHVSQSFQQTGKSLKPMLLKQFYSVVTWCFTTKQFPAAQHVIRWLVSNGLHLEDLSPKANILRDLELLAVEFAREDLLAENDRLKAALQE